MQWWYDGQSWVYALDQPPIKISKEEEQRMLKYSQTPEDPIGDAVMANMKGKFEKPKATPVRCDVCSLTVSCKVTYDSHINGKSHKKRVQQMMRMQQMEERQKAAEAAAVEVLPEGHPDNVLESTPGGDIHCCCGGSP